MTAPTYSTGNHPLQIAYQSGGLLLPLFLPRLPQGAKMQTNFQRVTTFYPQNPMVLWVFPLFSKLFGNHKSYISYNCTTLYDCYEELFGESLAAQNDRYTKSGHAERCKTIDEYRRSARTCPEETILQLGNRSGTVSPETVEQFLSLYLFHMRAKFGDKVRFLDVAIHNDESVPHAHIRRVWCATGKDTPATACVTAGRITRPALRQAAKHCYGAGHSS